MNGFKKLLKTFGKSNLKELNPYSLNSFSPLSTPLCSKNENSFLKIIPKIPLIVYTRENLYFFLGNLNLKIPRVRIGHSFRPAILPEPWKCIDKDYKELLIAVLSNGYSKLKSQRTLKNLGLPCSEETLEDVLNFIQEKLNFYRKQPLKPDWFAVFIDAFWTKIKAPESGKLQNLCLFVALGIDFKGVKNILGFWSFKGRES